MINSPDRNANARAEREARAKAARRAEEATIVAGLKKVLDPDEQLLGFARGRISGGFFGKLTIGPEAFFAPYVNFGLTERRFVLQHIHSETGQPGDILPHYFPISDIQFVTFSDIETFGGIPACRLALRLKNDQYFRIRFGGLGNFESARTIADLFRSLTTLRRDNTTTPTQRICAACKHLLDQPVKFCPYCGSKQEETTAQATSTTTAPPAPAPETESEPDFLDEALAFLAPEAPAPQAPPVSESAQSEGETPTATAPEAAVAEEATTASSATTTETPTEPLPPVAEAFAEPPVPPVATEIPTEAGTAEPAVEAQAPTDYAVQAETVEVEAPVYTEPTTEEPPMAYDTAATAAPEDSPVIPPVSMHPAVDPMPTVAPVEPASPPPSAFSAAPEDAPVVPPWPTLDVATTPPPTFEAPAATEDATVEPLVEAQAPADYAAQAEATEVEAPVYTEPPTEEPPAATFEIAPEPPIATSEPSVSGNNLNFEAQPFPVSEAPTSAYQAAAPPASVETPAPVAPPPTIPEMPVPPVSPLPTPELPAAAQAEANTSSVLDDAPGFTLPETAPTPEPPVEAPPAFTPSSAPVDMTRPIKVTFHINESLLQMHEVFVGENADDLVKRLKDRAAPQLPFTLRLLIMPMNPLAFAQEVVRRYNDEKKTSKPIPKSCAEFLTLCTDLGFATIEPAS